MYCLIVGQPNSGKTTFLVNFAAFLGLGQLKITIRQPQGFSFTHTLPLRLAQEELVGAEEHTTKTLQSIKATFPRGKRGKEVEIIDSCGLREGIHPCSNIRLAMAQTIRIMSRAHITLHVIDVTTISGNIALIDKEIYNYLHKKNTYCILANKIDQDEKSLKLASLKKQFPKINLYPISALYSWGFKEVYNFVLAHT